jgi:TonB family protein
MKNLCLIIAILLIGVSVNAQSSISKKDSTVNAFKIYLIRKTNYPAVARENDLQGDVAVCFKVDKNKRISEIKIVKALSAECDSAVLLSIRKFPGTLELHSKKYTVGLHFRIQKTDGFPIAPISPFNKKLFKRFLFDVNMIGYASIQKSTISIDVETIHK